MGGEGCSSGQVCDSLINICRQLCTSTADGGSSCPVGFDCIVDAQSTCHICRPKGGPGTFGAACSGSNSCGSGLTCDPIGKTCLFTCGTGNMVCGSFGNCPNGSGCDPMMGNVCRSLCTGGQCPSGSMCVTPSGSSCQICRPSATSGPTTLATTPGANPIAVDGTSDWTNKGDETVMKAPQ
jgi:hypothetical protein